MTKLDRTDHQILSLLQKDARRSNKDLAAQTGLAPSTVSERMRKLEDSGVFRGFFADIDPHALGVGLQALIAIRMTRHDREQVSRFRQYASHLAEVIGFYHVTGPNDFLVHVAVRDSEHLQKLALEAFTTQPEVAHIETSLIFEYVPNRIVPDYAVV